MPSSAPSTTNYTLSLHDALPISAEAAARTPCRWPCASSGTGKSSRRTGYLPARRRTSKRGGTCSRARARHLPRRPRHRHAVARLRDRKSTRLNSSHGYISYAVFCAVHHELHSFPTRRSSDLGGGGGKNAVPVAMRVVRDWQKLKADRLSSRSSKDQQARGNL